MARRLARSGLSVVVLESGQFATSVHAQQLNHGTLAGRATWPLHKSRFRIFGGSGTVWGAAIGAFLLVTINRALPSLGIEDFWQRAVVGALILGAIVLDRLLAIRQSRKLAEARDNA